MKAAFDLSKIPVNPFARGTECYKIKQREVKLHCTSTLYAMMHEQAHGIQHRNNTLIWRLGMLEFAVGTLWFLKLMVEIEAMLIARSILCYCNKWNHAAAREARESLLTYCPEQISKWIVNECINWSIQI